MSGAKDYVVIVRATDDDAAHVVALSSVAEAERALVRSGLVIAGDLLRAVAEAERVETRNHEHPSRGVMAALWRRSALRVTEPERLGVRHG